MHHYHRVILLPTFLAALTGCPNQNDEQAGGTDISSSIAVYAQKTPCPDVQPSAEDIPADTQLTPRADADAEQLSLEASCSIVAPEAVYQRVSAELTGIRAGFPALADYHYYTHYTSSLIVRFDESGASAFQGGGYHAWDELNQAYNAEVAAFLSDGATLGFLGRYNLPLLARQYTSLANVRSVDINILGTITLFDPNAPPRRDICLAIDHSDDRHYYLFTQQKTESPAVNITGSFEVDADGNITALDPRTLVETTPSPPWYQDCLTWLFGRH